MANIETRTNQDGTTTTYRVRWRKGGTATGKREGEPFKDPDAAEDFKAAVARAGEDWPWGYVPGVGWDAKAYAALIEDQRSPKPAPMKFAAYAEQWASLRLKASAQSRKEYRSDIAMHITPTFGAADIGDEHAISEATIGAWIVKLLSGADGTRPLAPSTVRQLHGFMHSILKAAVRQKLRTTNPCEDTELPPPHAGDDEDEMKFLTRHEFHVLLAQANPDVKGMLTVLVNTGLRWSELTALQVQDVIGLPGLKPLLRVRHSWKHDPDSEETWVLGPPKTRRSRRNVSVSNAVALVLADAVAGKKPTDFLFVTPVQSVVWRHESFFTRRWRPAVYRAIRCEQHRAEDGLSRVNTGGLRREHMKPCGCPGTLEKVPRIHDLRHSHVSWLIADGAPLTAVQRRIGHSSIQMTSDRYGHLLPEVDDAIVAKLDAKWQASLPGVKPEYGLSDYLLEVRTGFADAETEYFEAYQAWRAAGSPDPASSWAAAALRERIDEAHQLVQEARAELDRPPMRVAASVA